MPDAINSREGSRWQLAWNVDLLMGGSMRLTPTSLVATRRPSSLNSDEARTDGGSLPLPPPGMTSPLPNSRRARSQRFQAFLRKSRAKLISVRIRARSPWKIFRPSVAEAVQSAKRRSAISPRRSAMAGATLDLPPRRLAAAPWGFAAASAVGTRAAIGIWNYAHASCCGGAFLFSSWPLPSAWLSSAGQRCACSRYANNEREIGVHFMRSTSPSRRHLRLPLELALRLRRIAEQEVDQRRADHPRPVSTYFVQSSPTRPNARSRKTRRFEAAGRHDEDRPGYRAGATRHIASDAVGRITPESRFASRVAELEASLLYFTRDDAPDGAP